MSGMMYPDPFVNRQTTIGPDFRFYYKVFIHVIFVCCSSVPYQCGLYSLSINFILQTTKFLINGQNQMLPQGELFILCPVYYVLFGILVVQDVSERMPRVCKNRYYCQQLADAHIVMSHLILKLKNYSIRFNRFNSCYFSQHDWTNNCIKRSKVTNPTRQF